MRLNTTKRYYHFMYLYIILLVILAFDFFQHELSEGTVSGGPMLWPYVVIIYLFFLYRGNPVFIYDSDGEVLIVTSKEPMLSRFGKTFDKHWEFPKRKLTGYSFSSFPFKRSMVLKLESKEGGIKKIKVSISYITKEERKDLERSLRSILSKNKRAKEELNG